MMHRETPGGIIDELWVIALKKLAETKALLFSIPQLPLTYNRILNDDSSSS